MDLHQARTGDKLLWGVMVGQQGYATIRVNLQLSRVFHWRGFGNSGRSDFQSYEQRDFFRTGDVVDKRKDWLGWMW
jgi:hypothetical protein